MAQLPANVTIPQLPAATTLTLAEVIEAVQTSGGVGNSVQVALSQIMTTGFGGLPAGGGTGQIIEKASGTDFATQWTNISSLVTASTGLAESGSTTVALSLASTAGLSVLGVAAAGSAVPAALPGTAAQVLVVNDAGSGVGFGRVNLASSAAVTGVLAGTNMSAVNLSATGPGGVQNILQAANITAINLAATGAGGIQGVLGVPHGGSGTSTLTQNGILFGNAVATVGLTAAGNTALVLFSPGPLQSPAFGQVSLTAAVTGVLGVPNGGSGTSTLTANAVVYGAGTGAVGLLAPGATGQMLMGQGAAPPVMQYPGHTLLNTLPASNSTALSDTTSFTSTFNDYLLMIDSLLPANATAGIKMVYQTGGSFVAANYLNNGGTATTYGDFADGNNVFNAAGYGTSGQVQVLNVNANAVYKFSLTNIGFPTNATTIGHVAGVFLYNGGSAIVTGFQIAATTGNLSSGTIRVYGMRSA